MVGPRMRALLSPLRDRRARPLLLSFWAAELADGMISVIVPIAIYMVTEDVRALALVFLGRLVFGMVLASFGGYLADRLQRKHLLLVSYLVRIGLGAATLATQDSPILFAVLGTALGAFGAFDNPAAEGAIRSVYRHDLQAIAVMRKLAKTISQMIGPAVGGLLIGLTGEAGALWTSIGLVTIAGIVLLPAPRLPHRQAAQQVDELHADETPPDTTEARPRLLLPVLTASFASSFLIGVVIAAGVPHLASQEAAPDGAYGFALACYSFGAVIGAVVAGHVRWRDRDLPTVLVASAIVYGLIAALGLVGPWWMLAVSWLLWGIAFGPEDILSDRYLVARTPDRRLAGLYARWSNVGRVGAAAAYVVMFVLGSNDPSRLTLMISLGFAVAAPVLIVAALRIAAARRR